MIQAMYFIIIITNIAIIYYCKHWLIGKNEYILNMTWMNRLFLFSDHPAFLLWVAWKISYKISIYLTDLWNFKYLLIFENFLCGSEKFWIISCRYGDMTEHLAYGCWTSQISFYSYLILNWTKFSKTFVKLFKILIDFKDWKHDGNDRIIWISKLEA